MKYINVNDDMDPEMLIAIDYFKRLYGESFILKENGFYSIIHPFDVIYTENGYRIPPNARVLHRDKILTGEVQ